MVAHYGGNDEALRQAYEQYRQQGQIGFVSFHQSFGYEDFVEGIKPVLADAEDADEAATGLGYRVEAGIFKAMAERATYALHVQRQVRLADTGNLRPLAQLDFDELFTLFINQLRKQLEHSPDGIVESENRYVFVISEIKDGKNIRVTYRHQGRGKAAWVTKENIKNIYNDIIKRRRYSNIPLAEDYDTLSWISNQQAIDAVFYLFKRFENRVKGAEGSEFLTISGQP
nr:hypothetical protein [Tanacetum cinerariifolium]